MTIPSVILNKSDDESTNQDLRYLSGDWSLVQKLLSSEEQSTKYAFSFNKKCCLADVAVSE